MKVGLSEEEKFLQDLLFHNVKIDKKIFNKLNYDKLVKLSSSHLLLPALYHNLKINNYTSLIPVDLKLYLKKIYEINHQRNKMLMDEIHLIGKEFKLNKIKFSFIKGSLYLQNKIYKNIGERMIGDIDFLFKANEKKKVIFSLNNLGYYNNLDFKIFRKRHLQRFINKQKILAVEPHINILRNKNDNFLNKDYISNKIDLNGLIDICILSHQINDFGFLEGSYSYKNIYDFFNIYKLVGVGNIKHSKNKYFKRYFIITNSLGLTDFDIRLNIKDKIFIKRFELKRKIKIYFFIDNFISKILKNLYLSRFQQLIEFLINSNYRKSILKIPRFFG